MRVLVGGVGYRYLRDDSVGPWVTEQLAQRACDGVEVEDLSDHPVGLVHNLQERAPYDRLVLVGSVRRDRAPGTVEAYRWDRRLPPPEKVQERVAEAVTGVISLENLLIVTEALHGLPPDVRVVEVEPGPERWGEGFSPEVQGRLEEILETVWTSTRR